MKTFLVTGGAGFIGSNLVEELVKRGNKVKVIDSLVVGDNNVEFLKRLGVELYKEDISNFDRIKDLFKGVDIVIHLAAMNRAQKSIIDPLRANQVNITGTLNCLEAARQAKVKKFVNISSSSVYAGREGALAEDYMTNPPHPYGAGKLAGEHYTRLYNQLYGMNTLTLRYFSVYGPRQLGHIDKAGVVAKFIYKAYNDEPLEIYGNGNKMRNFSFVKDVVNMTILAAENDSANGEVINIASEEEISINQLVEVIKKNIKNKKIKVKYTEELKGDPDRNPPNIEKAKKILKYKPKYNFESGIKKTIEWFKKDYPINKNKKINDKEINICVVGLGYVGLPLAVKFGLSKFNTFGFDINKNKIEQLNNNYDFMNEVSEEELIKTKTKFTSNPKIISKANFIIIAVPTPVDNSNQPDITYLKKASELVGRYMKKGTTVVFESTVYPGCTEEDCVPVLEETSKLRYGKDFFVGYSPERINPGDKEHTIDKIIKVVSGMNEDTLNLIAEVYSEIVKVGVFKASSIKVAEAAKVIENTQRDINIALMNELAMIFEKMNISTFDVLKTAGTKWNFLKFTPGLVGGHCIGVDPYYLVYKSKLLGYLPEIITSGRRINDNMPIWITNQIIKLLIKNNKIINKSKILILGLTFKENVNDMRNSKVRNIIQELHEFGVEVIGHDPYLTKEEVLNEFKIKNISKKDFSKYKKKFDAIILATQHNEFKNLDLNKIFTLCTKNPVFYDIKGIYNPSAMRNIGFNYKRL